MNLPLRLKPSPHRLIALTAWMAALLGAPSQVTAADGARPIITIAHADALIAKLPADDPWVRAPDASTLAWSESHLLHAFVDLYEATGDAKYLVEVARRGERLLTHRDDRRGIADGSGHARPAWTMAGKFVVAEARALDAAGQPRLAFRSTPSAYNNQTHLEITPEAGGRFTLTLANAQFRREERFANVSLDPSDARFVETIVNAPKPTNVAKAGTFSDASNLVLVSVLAPRAAGPALAAQKLALKPIPLAYMGYLGVIYHPLLRFAEIVRSDARLAELSAAAGHFVAAAEESYADASRRLWRDGPNADEGFYLCCERGESFPFDNVGQPFNYLGRHTAAELALHRLTGKAEYRERAAKMARLFKHRLKLDTARDRYTWRYWYEPVTTTGWTAANSPSQNIPNLGPAATIEDISHGVLDIALVVSSHAAGVVFDETDLKRFADTLLTNVLNPERTGVRRRVDGSAGEYPAYFPALAGWLELAEADAAVYREIRRTVETNGPDNLTLVAALLKWEKRLK